MPTKIQIVGCGERRTGTGKNGKAYDFVNVHFLYEDKYTEGMAAASCMIDGKVFEEQKLIPGTFADVIMVFKDYRPSRLYFV